MKLRKLISLLLCLTMLLSCVLSLAACGKDKNKDQGGTNNPGGTIVGGNTGGSTVNGETEYTVQVVTVGGMPLEGVMVYIHNGEGYSVCTAPQETDENGFTKCVLTNMNEEFAGNVPREDDIVRLEFAPWQILTLRIN